MPGCTSCGGPVTGVAANIIGVRYCRLLCRSAYWSRWLRQRVMRPRCQHHELRAKGRQRRRHAWPLRRCLLLCLWLLLPLLLRLRATMPCMLPQLLRWGSWCTIGLLWLVDWHGVALPHALVRRLPLPERRHCTRLASCFDAACRLGIIMQGSVVSTSCGGSLQCCPLCCCLQIHRFMQIRHHTASHQVGTPQQRGARAKAPC